MVRMQAAEPGAGTHPQVVDDLVNTAGSSAGSKRARSQATSSLDYKPPGSNNNREGGTQQNVVHPNKLGYEQQAQQQQQQPQQQQHQQQRPKITTRARGSGGIPPRSSLDLSDLEGMSEEQIMQALYEDPELAELAAEQIAKAQKEGTTLNADRVEAIDTGRIPYEQWGILLVLMGFGFLQLYKSLSGPSSASNSTSRGKKGRDSSPPAKGKSKGKGKKARSAKATPKKVNEDVVEKVVAEIEASAPEESGKNSKPAAAKSKKKKKQPAKPAPKEEEPPKPAVKEAEKPKSTDPGETDSLRAGVAAPIHTSVITEADTVDDTWETVSKSKPSRKKKAGATSQFVAALANQQTIAAEKNNEEPMANGASKKADDAAPAPEPAPEPTPVPVTPDSGANPEDEAAVIVDEDGFQTARKKKKKKKKGVAPVVGTNVTGAGNGMVIDNDDAKSDDTLDDEALALQLQQEEENLAAGGSGGKTNGKDAWEEVSTKKKKKKAQ